MRFVGLLCLSLLVSVSAGAAEMRLGPGGCLVLSDLTFSPASGNPEIGQGPHLRGKLHNLCNSQMAFMGTAIFSNGNNQVGDAPIAQQVGKGMTASFDALAITQESAKATTASLSSPQAAAQ